MPQSPLAIVVNADSGSCTVTEKVVPPLTAVITPSPFGNPLP